jgi:hypothetical protein
MEAATVNRRSNPFASAVATVRGARRTIEKAVDDGALDSTADGIEPVTDQEVLEVLERHVSRERP